MACQARHRASIYDEFFHQRIKNMGIEEVVTAPRSPWQNPLVERLIGSIRREFLNHIIIIERLPLPASRTHANPPLDTSATTRTGFSGTTRVLWPFIEGLVPAAEGSWNSSRPLTSRCGLPTSGCGPIGLTNARGVSRRVRPSRTVL